jgi:hypothetical protein
MRRLLATVALAAALVTPAACASERDGVGAPPPSGTGTPSDTSASEAPATGAPESGPTQPPSVAGAPSPAGGNAKEVCEAATTASAEHVRVFVEELGKSLQANAAKDAAAARAAQRRAEEALRAWSSAMREQSARATDERLKAVLADIGAEVATMKASVDSIDEAKLDQLQQRLDQLCVT